MSSKKIILVGAGQLGSRYLQGLIKSKIPLEIWLQDPSRRSVEVAMNRLAEDFGPSHSLHQVKIVSDEVAKPKIFDLAIVATSADVRPTVVTEIRSEYEIKYWILEKVLAQSEGGINEILNTIGGSPAWVNTPVHLWSLYANVRDALTKGAPIDAVIENFEGLACSSIHFIDFIARCNGSTVITIDSSGLEPDWVKSKRSGFMEVNGELVVKFSDNSTLRLIGHRDAPYHYTTKIACGNEIWEIDNYAGLATSSYGLKLAGKCEFQSELTAQLVESIFSSGECGLPTLEESAEQHKVLLRVLLEHFKRFNMHEEVLPIT
jgi:hypothetical protein